MKLWNIDKIFEPAGFRDYIMRFSEEQPFILLDFDK